MVAILGFDLNLSKRILRINDGLMELNLKDFTKYLARLYLKLNCKYIACPLVWCVYFKVQVCFKISVKHQTQTLNKMSNS